MNKYDLIDGFVNYNYTGGIASRLEVVGNKLWNYKTIIAIRLENGDIVLNSCHYSMTTSSNQNMIRDCSWRKNLYEINNYSIFYNIAYSKNDKEAYKIINKHYKNLRTSKLGEDKEIIDKFIKGHKTGQNKRLRNSYGVLYNKYTEDKIAYKDDEGFIIVNSNYFNSHVLKYLQKNENIIILSDDEVFRDFETMECFDKVKFRLLINN